MSDAADWATTVAERIVGNPLGSHLGMRLVDAEPGRVRARLPFAVHNTTMGEQVHGGAIAALIDAVATAVAWSGADADQPPSFGTTVSLETRYLAAARGCDLVATGTVPKRGGSICFCHVDVHDPEGLLVAQGDAVYKLARAR